MGFDSLKDVDSVKESPLKKRKLDQSQSVPKFSEYDSQDDSGDNLLEDFETVATLPLSSQVTQRPFPSSRPQHVTQPTQVLGNWTQNGDSHIQSRAPSSSNVQVTASSPVQPSSSKAVPSASRQKIGGVLAAAMAPAGTAFRLPPGIQRPTRPMIPVIDISDDDGPTYQGDTSDDEASRAVGLKPSRFAKPDPPVDAIRDSPIKGDSLTGFNRFKSITSASIYKPETSGSKIKHSGLSGSIYDSRNRNEQATSSQLPTSVAPLKKQSGPQRANPVADISLSDVHDFALRTKIERVQRVLPWATVYRCRDALLQKKGNYEDALDWLVTQRQAEEEMEQRKSERKDPVDLTLSDEDHMKGKKTAAKRQIKAPNRSIKDKWSNTQANPRPENPSASSQGLTHPATPPKARKRLVQGRKAPSTPSNIASATSRSARIASPGSDALSDSGVVISTDVESVLEAKVLEFLNTCSGKELEDIAVTSEETAMVVLAQRPFKTLEAIRQIYSPALPSAKTATRKKNAGRAIGQKIVETCLDTWTGYEAVDELVSKCEALGKPVAAEMKKWGFDIFGSKTGELELLQLGTHQESVDSGLGTPTGSPRDAEAKELDVEDAVRPSTRTTTKGRNDFLAQPKIMSDNTVLKDYQLVGLNWLSLLYKQGLSCILADDMGLGKTCQVISFLAHLLEFGIKGPHLIVVPGSTLENWLQEFKTFCPALVVEPYYGPQAEREYMRENIEGNINEINVIVTTYDLASKKPDNKFLRHLKCNTCVYDEGHALKNTNSQRYGMLMRIPAKFRLLLTGTPLQNNLKELAALLGFILPSVFNERRGDLEFVFKHRAKTTDESHAALLSAQRIARARSMMTPFVLRRKKHQVLKHLPAKMKRIEYCELTTAQAEIYHGELQKAREAVEARAAGAKVVGNSSNVMMALRKAAIHPLLFRRLFDDDKIRKMARECLNEPEYLDSDADAVYEDMEYCSDFELHTFCEKHPTTMSQFNIQNDEWMDSGKVEKLTHLLLKFRENGERVLLFSQFTMVLDILEAVLETLDMQFFRLDGQTKIDERQDMLDEFHNDAAITVFLLSTKAGGQGINLTCANKVIIFDQSFNPQEDLQAENRAHRLGQQKEVEVIRLITRGTIEEQMHSLGESKLVLDSRVAGEEIGEKGGKELEAKGVEMMEELILKGDTAISHT